MQSFIIHLGSAATRDAVDFVVLATDIDSLIDSFECVTEVGDGSAWLDEFNPETTADVYCTINDTPVNVLITESNQPASIGGWAAIREKLVFELSL